jgi:hypothetical protein
MSSALLPDTACGDVVPVIIEQAINRVTIEVRHTTRGPTWEVKVTVYDADLNKAERNARRVTTRIYATLDDLYGD